MTTRIPLALAVLVLGGSLASQPSVTAAGSTSQAGCDITIPTADASPPEVGLTLQLPDGSSVDALGAGDSIVVPSNADITLSASTADAQGARNVQLWIGEQRCTSSGQVESCSGPGLLGRPAIENPDPGAAGQPGCRERRAAYTVRLRASDSSRTSYEVHVVGTNFGGQKVTSRLIWLRPGPNQPPNLAHNAHDLQPGQGLRKGESITSPGGCFTLQMQSDGNVVLYTFGRPIWSTSTHRNGGEYVVMQQDGNLVVYDRWGAPAWASGTNGNPGARLFVQSDGNLVVNHNGVAKWASNSVTQCVDPQCLSKCTQSCSEDFQECLQSGGPKAGCVAMQRACRDQCRQDCRR